MYDGWAWIRNDDVEAIVRVTSSAVSGRIYVAESLDGHWPRKMNSRYFSTTSRRLGSLRFWHAESDMSVGSAPELRFSHQKV